jgi:hypothetical protein
MIEFKKGREGSLRKKEKEEGRGVSISKSFRK